MGSAPHGLDQFKVLRCLLQRCNMHTDSLQMFLGLRPENLGGLFAQISGEGGLLCLHWSWRRRRRNRHRRNRYLRGRKRRRRDALRGFACAFNIMRYGRRRYIARCLAHPRELAFSAGNLLQKVLAYLDLDFITKTFLQLLEDLRRLLSSSAFLQTAQLLVLPAHLAAYLPL